MTYVLAIKKFGSVLAASESLTKIKSERKKRGNGKIYKLVTVMNKRKGKYEVIDWKSL